MATEVGRAWHVVGHDRVTILPHRFPHNLCYPSRDGHSPNRDRRNRLFSGMASTLFVRLDARDRALLMRWAIGEAAPRAVRLFWLTVTHLGGVVCSVLIALL